MFQALCTINPEELPFLNVCHVYCLLSIKLEKSLTFEKHEIFPNDDFLYKAERALLGDCSSNSLQMQTVVDQTISLLRSLSENDIDFQSQWSSLESAFYDVFQCLQEQNLDLYRRPTSVAQVSIASKCTGQAGRPSFQISQEVLEDLRVKHALPCPGQDVEMLLGPRQH